MHWMPKESFLIFQVEELNTLVSELAKVTAKEQASLEQCKDFLSMIATMQVMQPFHCFAMCSTQPCYSKTFIICGTG